MNQKTCQVCQKIKDDIEAHPECEYELILKTSEEQKELFLKKPSLGALFFTQFFAFGSRLYLLFLGSLIPVVGIVVLIVCVLYGRKLSYRFGGWESWKLYEKRMILLDRTGIVWVLFLAVLYLIKRFVF